MEESKKGPKMELEFTPRTIKEIEDVGKRPLMDVISDYSMGTITLFVRKGLGISEDDAFHRIDKFFKDGGDMMSLYILILETLKDRGFLPKVLDLTKMKEKLQVD